MHPSLFNIGGVAVPSQIVFWFLAIAVGGIVLTRLGTRHGTHWKLCLDALIALIVGGVLGGRLMVILLHFDWFNSYWKQIFILSVGGFHIYGAIIGAAIAVYVVVWWYSYHYLRLCDLLATVSPLMIAIACIGNFFQGIGFGQLTEKRIGMVSPDHAEALLHFSRHPSQLYLAITCLVLFVVFSFVGSRKQFHGYITALFLISLPLIFETIWLTMYRSVNQPLFAKTFGPMVFSMDTLIALVIMANGVALFLYQRSQRY